MKPSEIVAALVALRAYFPQSRVPDETLALYAADLEGVRADALAAALLKLRRHGDGWFPALSKIIEAVGLASTDSPTPDEAWRQIVKRASAWFPGMDGSNLPAVHPLVDRVAKEVGWFMLTERRSDAVERKFMRIYAERRAEEGQAASGISALLPETEAVRNLLSSGDEE